jgi:excisionase family DNA binding protein
MKNDTTNTDMRLISVPEACRRLGIGRCSIYKLINARTLKTVKIGARRLISVEAVKDCIALLEDGT